MKKIVVFNVGGAMSCFMELEGKRIIVDLGCSPDFSPVNDFLLVLASRGKLSRSNQNGKYFIDQLFLSHLDDDHISSYESFSEKFHPIFMTCPNDNEKQNPEFKVNRDLLGTLNRTKEMILRDMSFPNRTPIKENNPHGMSDTNPLVPTIEGINLFYIKPSTCEVYEALKESYANNISLVILVKSNNKTVLLPGDIMTSGMDFLIENNSGIRTLLSQTGIDYLVAPHHGLQTAFSEKLFQTILGKKTRLNIISEKPRTPGVDDNRTAVDTRYYSSDYSNGINTLGQNAVKTSGGHIVIDLELSEAEVKQYTDIDDVINEFI